jgi:starch phosphorylase
VVTVAAIANINPKVAYFSMEIGLDPSIPTYSGGLGILAGDFLKSAADLGAPVVGVSLLYNRGYFTQNIINGNQVESYQHYDPRQHMIELPQRIKVPIEDRMVSVKAWLYQLKGNQGKSIPILFLDTNGVDNRPWDENITNTLYGGTHPYHRLTQEIVLGIGGVRMLHELNMVPETYHLNEGHGALATLELLNMTGSADKVRERTVFTTHT